MYEARLDSGGRIYVKTSADPEVATSPSPGVQVLVRTEYSLISPGTETGIIRRVREEGLGEAGYLALGYCAAGVIVGKDEAVKNVAVGDRVACYGAPYVRHSGILAVPRTLVVQLPDEVSTREGAFCGLGAIAIHGLRLTRLQFGESLAIVGLGLIGQLAVQVAVAAGYRVFGMDLLPARLKLARRAGAELAVNSSELAVNGNAGDPVMAIKSLTEGLGVDAVLVCAASRSPELIQQALRLVRPQGRIVVVGDVNLTIHRDLMFNSEAEVVVARAAGAGRYDESYERLGYDYPLAYVRWTVNRNIQEFVRLISRRRVNVVPLISAEYQVTDAPMVYEAMMTGPSAALGVLLRYESIGAQA
ncbi:MAG: zinc-binding alcohol dehydrogenase [Bacillota bacterium]